MLIMCQSLSQAPVANDTIDSTVTIPTDSFIDEKIDYDAEDSIRFDVVNQKVCLYGKAFIKYGDIELRAGFISFDFATKTVQARPINDSLGNPSQLPTFNDKGQEFRADLMDYNFDTKKGLVVGSKTKQDEGYLHGDTVKSQGNNEYHMKNGKYTTCELDHPHFYFQISKAIVKPNDKIIAKYINLKVNDVPTPLWLPLGYFPNKQRKGHGIVIPTYDNSERYGFGLREGGYYIPFLNKDGEGIADLQILGSIYLGGSFGLRTVSRYKQIYKYGGDLALSYQRFSDGYKELENLNRSTNYEVRWNHRQDPKARPNSSFSANVNFISRNSYRQSFNINEADFLTNTTTSGIQYRRTIPNTPFSFSVNAGQNYNTSSGLMNITLPDFSWNMNRISPLSFLTNKPRKSSIIKSLAKTYLTWNAKFTNQLTTYDSLLTFDNAENLLNQMRNGAQHTITTGASFKLLKKKITFNPSLNLTERWYFQTLEKRFDNTIGEVVSDTMRQFWNDWDRAMTYRLGANFTTKLYGYYGFAKFLQSYRKSIFRHTFTPSVNFSYNPSFDTRKYGFYGANGTAGSYSPLDLGFFGPPSPSESGSISVNLQNKLDMKMNAKTDTGLVEKKYSIIDQFNVSSGYDFFRDSIRFSNLRATTTLFKTFTLNANASLDPYYYDSLGGTIVKFDKSLYSQTGKIGRLTSADLSFSFNLNGDKFKKKVDEAREQNQNNERDLDIIQNNANEFVDFDIPWNISSTYTIRRTKRYFLKYNPLTDLTELIDSATINQYISVNGDVSLTKNWRIGVSTGYDFSQKQLSFTSIDIYRNLHCWEMRFNWIPFGQAQSYNFQINVKASVLKDLKLTRRRAWFDNQIQ